MGGEAIFRLAADMDAAHRDAQTLFEKIRHDLATILPASALIEHIGATAVPGCMTKGDLDIVVRVDRADFVRSETALASRFACNSGSIRTEDFAAFEAPGRRPHLGIQLTVKGGQFDVFHLFVAALRDDPALVRRYNALKIRQQGDSMNVYRTAKDAFIGGVLRNLELKTLGKK